MHDDERDVGMTPQEEPQDEAGREEPDKRADATPEIGEVASGQATEASRDEMAKDDEAFETDEGDKMAVEAPEESEAAGGEDAAPDPLDETELMPSAAEAGEAEDHGSEETVTPRRGGRRLAVALCAVAVAALLCLVAACAAGAFDAPDRGNAVTEQEAGVASITLAPDAEGWQEGSSPFLVHVTGTTDEGEEVDLWHAVWPDGRGKVLELAPGDYVLEWVSAINADGSIYVVPGPSEVSLAGEAEQAPSFEPVPADEVTQDQLDEILDAIAGAVEGGDETLSGDAGKEVADLAADNASKAPNADEEAVEEAKQEAKDKADASQGGSSASSGSGSTGSSGSGSAGSGGSGSNGGSSGGSSASQHVHNWVPVTSQQWVVDQQAWDEQVPVGEVVVCYCGATFNSTSAWSSHTQQFPPGSEQFGQHAGYSVQTQWQTIHHDAVGHYETVTTGYRCSGCGATR